MSFIGFMVNMKEGVPPTRDFALFRIAPMSEVLETLGARLLVYSPRHIDPETGTVSGFVVENGRFVPETAPVPAVNGSWFIGRDKSAKATMNVRQVRAFAAENGIDVYPLREFSNLLKDKLATSRLIRNFDSKLEPHTEAYEGTQEQLARFVRRYKTVFLKPRFGNRGEDIYSIRKAKGGLVCSYYADKKKRRVTHENVGDAFAVIDKAIGKASFLIQRGVEIDRFKDSPFILRVIMLDDGKEWQWVHKAVLAAPGSDIANTTQGGYNSTTMALFTTLYGADKAAELFEEVRRVSFDCVRYLDTLFPGRLMEVAFDFVLDKNGRVKVLEVNTLPGMTKPGLPPSPAFLDILNRQPSEQEIYEKLILPHGTHLAHFLHTKLEERQARALRPETRGVAADSLRAGADVEAPATPEGPVVDPAESRLHQAITRQARHLVDSCLPDGSFRHRQDEEPGKLGDPRFEVLRHISVMHALDAYDRWRPNAGVRDAALRAGEYLKTHCIAPIPGEDHLLAVWSRSEFNYLGEPDQVRLGWSGLGLIALLDLERHRPGFSSIEELRALGEFLLWAQNDDGSFRSLFAPAQGGWKGSWKSPDYPGQASLALLMLHELDPSPRWVQAAADAIGYLARSREKAKKIPADYWALMATARLLPVFHECEPTVARDDVIRHARQICQAMLDRQVHDPNKPVVDGGFAKDGRTDSAATRIRGLLAAQVFMDDEDPQFSESLRSATKRGIAFLALASVPDGSTVEPMPKFSRPVSEDARKAARAARRRASAVNNDHVRIALSAMAEYALHTEPAGPADAAVPSPAPSQDALLFTPGPLTTSPGVKAAMLRDLGSRDTEFIASIQRIRDDLLRIAGVSQESGYEAVLMQGSGTFAIESVLSSAVPRDGRLLVISNGAYAERIAEIATRHSIETEVLRFAEDQLPDVPAIERALGAQGPFTHVAVVHCETSTGMMNPVAEIGAVAQAHGCSYFVDSMSAFGAVPVDLEGWGVDYLVSSANKCIQGVPGFAFALCRRAALEACRGRARSVSLDLFAQWQGLEANGQFRFTPPTHALLASEAALQELDAEGGVEARGARYRANHACLVEGMRRLGFREALAPELQGPIITSFHYPKDANFDFAELYARLNEKGFVIYPGKLTSADCFRIGTIGHLFERDVQALLAVLEAVVDEMGITLEPVEG